MPGNTAASPNPYEPPAAEICRNPDFQPRRSWISRIVYAVLGGLAAGVFGTALMFVYVVLVGLCVQAFGQKYTIAGLFVVLSLIAMTDLAWRRWRRKLRGHVPHATAPEPRGGQGTS